MPMQSPQMGGRSPYVPPQIHSPAFPPALCPGTFICPVWDGTVHRDHRQKIRKKESEVEVFIPFGASLWGHQGQAVPINQRSQCHGCPAYTVLFFFKFPPAAPPSSSPFSP